MKTDLASLTNLIRSDILTMTTNAGSGHPTSSLSAVELMTTLWFDGHYTYDEKDPKYIFNDRMIFSKGHAAPLLYALYHAAGWIEYNELMTLRKFDSRLEGHPTTDLPWVDVATGSLGQGLSVGVGMALAIKLKISNSKAIGGRAGGIPAARNKESTDGRIKRGRNLSRIPRVYVLMGDSEFSEGQVYEAMQIAAQYKLNNLIGILDVNRLGQRGATMLEWDLKTYEARIKSFGWNTLVIEHGNDIDEVQRALSNIRNSQFEIRNANPLMIIAKTKKGASVSSIEDKDGWHGKPLPQDMLEIALKELGEVNKKVRGQVQTPEKIKIRNVNIETRNNNKNSNVKNSKTVSDFGFRTSDLQTNMATRQAYGEGLKLIAKDERVVVLDAETSNSTFARTMKEVAPERFFEMFIAEQNMVSVALGMSKIGLIPYASSFAAFLSRAYDQIRMCQYSPNQTPSTDSINSPQAGLGHDSGQASPKSGNVKIVGSHAGVSIGEDGSSQMALEDLAIMRALLHAVVLYPSDPVSTIKLMDELRTHEGISYLRLTRAKTANLYKMSEQFPIGGSKVLAEHDDDKAVVIAAGITVHEALKAQKQLAEKNTNIAVIDAYCVKPIDKETIIKYAKRTGHVIVVEDHYPDGGLGDGVCQALVGMDVAFTHLSVKKTPRSGTPEELLAFEEIDAEAIIKAVS